ncbi:MAG TPA: N-acetyl-gamma-glutamyl-phosphate reductase [Gemmatimonadaceae bacterium]|nr:N-acetyl-gamma-glutamyl-phosphate reductase [Gemmatimonadaceae bacterium]
MLGASGYAGRELCAIVHRHPAFELAFATANEQRGQTVHINGRAVTFTATEDAPLGAAELVFSSLPHGASRTWVEAARSAGARVVDLSSDLRPGHGVEGIPYGLTELAREEVKGAPVVANPGCYPTSILLALAPFVARGLVAEGRPIIANSASGVTGAGNSAKREYLFGEVAEDYRAYGAGNTHRHLHEMRAMLGRMQSRSDLIFTPHLLPVTRGILSTITLELREPLADPMAVWRERYAGEPFVELVQSPPRLRDVAYRNAVQLFAQPLTGTERPMLLLLSAIDNLVKGAAGQAVQNANCMLGLDETAGLLP